MTSRPRRWIRRVMRRIVRPDLSTHIRSALRFNRYRDMIGTRGTGNQSFRDNFNWDVALVRQMRRRNPDYYAWPARGYPDYYDATRDAGIFWHARNRLSSYYPYGMYPYAWENSLPEP